MKLNRPPDVARNPFPAAGAGRRRGRRPGTGVIRLISVTALAAAACALWAIPAGASAHQPAAPAASAAKKHASHTTVSAKPKTAKVGASVRLSATVKSSGKTPKGSVTFSAGGKKLCDARLSKGSAHCDAKFSVAGTHKVKGAYSGDSQHRGSWGTTSVTVDRYTTTTAVSVSTATPYPGESVTLSAAVSSKSKAAPTGKVKFSYSGGALCSGTLKSGTAHCNYTWPAVGGPYTVTGAYAGDAAHAGSSGTAGVTVKLLATTTAVTVGTATPYPGESVTLSATVSSAVTATGTVDFSDAGGHLCTGTLAGGTAQCAYTWAAKGGPYTITGTYSGDATHAGSAGTAAGTVTVTPLATTTKITNINPVRDPAGDPSVITVTVTSATGPVPTGTVKVASTNGAGVSCTATLADGTGSCTITPPVPSFGDIFLEGTYSGDAAHTKSVSTGQHELIVPDTTTTTLTFDPATGTSGDPETLTATVVDQAGGNISPSAGGTGTVTFTVGATTVCAAAPLTYDGAGDNVATCTFTPEATGPDAVKAVYSGDENNLTSTGKGTLTVS